MAFGLMGDQYHGITSGGDSRQLNGTLNSGHVTHGDTFIYYNTFNYCSHYDAVPTTTTLTGDICGFRESASQLESMRSSSTLKHSVSQQSIRSSSTLKHSVSQQSIRSSSTFTNVTNLRTSTSKQCLRSSSTLKASAPQQFHHNTTTTERYLHNTTAAHQAHHSIATTQQYPRSPALGRSTSQQTLSGSASRRRFRLEDNDGSDPPSVTVKRREKSKSKPKQKLETICERPMALDFRDKTFGRFKDPENIATKYTPYSQPYSQESHEKDDDDKARPLRYTFELNGKQQENPRFLCSRTIRERRTCHNLRVDDTSCRIQREPENLPSKWVEAGATTTICSEPDESGSDLSVTSSVAVVGPRTGDAGYRKPLEALEGNNASQYHHSYDGKTRLRPQQSTPNLHYRDRRYPSAAGIEPSIETRLPTLASPISAPGFQRPSYNWESSSLDKTPNQPQPDATLKRQRKTTTLNLVIPSMSGSFQPSDKATRRKSTAPPQVFEDPIPLAAPIIRSQPAPSPYHVAHISVSAPTLAPPKPVQSFTIPRHSDALPSTGLESLYPSDAVDVPQKKPVYIMISGTPSPHEMSFEQRSSGYRRDLEHRWSSTGVTMRSVHVSDLSPMWRKDDRPGTLDSAA